MVQSRQEVAFNWIPVPNCEGHEIILPSCRPYATPTTWFCPVGHNNGAKRTDSMPAKPSVELETDRYRDRQDIGAGFHGDEICTAPHSLWTSINHRRPGPVCRYRNDVTQDMSCACQRSQGFRPGVRHGILHQSCLQLLAVADIEADTVENVRPGLRPCVDDGRNEIRIDADGHGITDMPPGRFRRLPTCVVEVLADVETAGLDVFALDAERLQGSQDAVHCRRVVLLSLLHCRSVRLDTKVHMGDIWYKRLLGRTGSSNNPGRTREA